MKKKYKLHPSKEYPWFCNDPLGDTTYHKTEQLALEQAAVDIDGYLEDVWDEEVVNVTVGKISHVVVMCDVVHKTGELDDDGVDEAGVYWRESTYEYSCNYKMEDLL